MPVQETDEEDFDQDVTKPRSEIALEIIRNSILHGPFKPGDFLVERDLCELANVSRSAVREALRALDAEGLVTRTPNKRPTVTQVSRSEIQQIYQVRVLLEGFACQLFVLNASQADIDALEAAFDRILIAHQPIKPRAFVEASADFYDVILSASGNEIIREIHNTLTRRLSYLRRLGLSFQGRTNESIHSARQIVDAAKSRDPQWLRDSIIQHLKIVEQKTIAALDVKTTGHRKLAIQQLSNK